MRKIIYTRPDGGLSIVHPSEGARLASGMTLADGQEIIAFTPESRPADTFVPSWPPISPPKSISWAETEDEWLSRVMEKSVPTDAINPQFVDESAIPTDRTFRDAWAHGGDKIDVDMPKAVEIQQDKLRALRAPLFTSLDSDYMRALETGDKAAQVDIAAKKQALRDVTADPALAAAKTPRELKAVIPAILIQQE